MFAGAATAPAPDTEQAPTPVTRPTSVLTPLAHSTMAAGTAVHEGEGAASLRVGIPLYSKGLLAAEATELSSQPWVLC